MSALGFMLVGFGILTAWSGLERVDVFDILRSFVGQGPSTTSFTGTGSSSSSPTPAPVGNTDPTVPNAPSTGAGSGPRLND